MKKFTFKLSTCEARDLSQLLSNFVPMACSMNTHTELAGMVLGDWFEKKKGRLAFSEAGRYGMSLGEAYALHLLLEATGYFPHIFLELDKLIVNERRRRQTLYKQIEDAETL